MTTPMDGEHLVLGGTAGIGFAYAEHCAANRHAVYLVGRDPSGLHQAAACLLAAGARSVRSHAGDLRSSQFRVELRQELTDQGVVPFRSILVGGPSPSPGILEQVTLSDMDVAYDLCVRYPVEMMRWALAGAVSSGGEVIVVSSSASKEPLRGARFALSALFRRALDELETEFRPQFDAVGLTLTIWRPKVVVTRLSLAYAQRASGADDLTGQTEWLKRLFDVPRVPTASEFVRANRASRSVT